MDKTSAACVSQIRSSNARIVRPCRRRLNVDAGANDERVDRIAAHALPPADQPNALLLRSIHGDRNPHSIVRAVALGNIAWPITPLGFVTREFRDATGRDTLTTAPIDSAQTVFTSNRTVYDLATAPHSRKPLGRKVSSLKSRQVYEGCSSAKRSPA